MSKKNHNSKKENARLASKKAAVLGNNKKSRLPLVLAVCAVLIIGAGVAVVLNQGGGQQQAAAAGAVSANAELVTFPVAMFADGNARHFEHRNGRHTIRFFVLKSSDGVIRAAFDACDVCWPAGKGYYQEGDYMVCRNCGRRFASVLVNEVKGGCNPAPLNRALQGDQLVIQVKDILEGRRYFNFS